MQRIDSYWTEKQNDCNSYLNSPTLGFLRNNRERFFQRVDGKNIDAFTSSAECMSIAELGNKILEKDNGWLVHARLSVDLVLDPILGGVNMHDLADRENRVIKQVNEAAQKLSDILEEDSTWRVSTEGSVGRLLDRVERILDQVDIPPKGVEASKKLRIEVSQIKEVRQQNSKMTQAKAAAERLNVELSQISTSNRRIEKVVLDLLNKANQLDLRNKYPAQ